MFIFFGLNPKLDIDQVHYWLNDKSDFAYIVAQYLKLII
jgi:hypothetical protein